MTKLAHYVSLIIICTAVAMGSALLMHDSEVDILSGLILVLALAAIAVLQFGLRLACSRLNYQTSNASGCYAVIALILPLIVVALIAPGSRDIIAAISIPTIAGSLSGWLAARSSAHSA